MVKISYSEESELRKGAWTPEEDKKLIAYIQRYDHWNWRRLPKYAGVSRCGKSCRLRWLNYQRPYVKRGNFSREEDEIIISLHQSLGNRWSAIAARLPGRTDNEIENCWHACLEKRLKQNQTASEANLHNENFFECRSRSKSPSEPNTFLPTAPTQRILESSPLFMQPFSSDLSSLSTDSTVVTNTNWVTGENTVSIEEFAEPIGNFWTEPFLSGNSYIQEDFSRDLVDPEFLFPFSPVSLGEPLYTNGLYNNNGIDGFN